MKNARPFKQVDVFTSVPMFGNPVAVILDGTGLCSEQMQQAAQWTNLSETTFVLPPSAAGADYHVRIFTPRAELPFAGHPTLGTAHAVIEAGMVQPKNGKVFQQCAVGIVEVTVAEDGRMSFQLPGYSFETAPDVAALVNAIGGAGVVIGTPRIVNVGPRWVIVEMASVAAVETLTPNLAALAHYDRTNATTGLTVYASSSTGDVTVRSFAPADGIEEDPVCGSGNASVAAYRLAAGQIAETDAYRVSQGRQMGRDGHVFVATVDGSIHVGGACVTCVDGTFRVDS
jgi:PhzF family phenazine biosynthesis protein